MPFSIPTDLQRKSLEMTREEWAFLDTLARGTESLASRGPNVGEPSWRVLIRRLARGDYDSLVVAWQLAFGLDEIVER